jgi:transcription factor E2F7/8
MNTNKQTTLPDKDAQSVAEERNTTTKNNQTSQLNDNKKDESKTRRVMLHEKQNLKDLELERSSTNKTTTPTHSFRPVSQFSPGGPLLAPLHIDLPPIPSPSPTSHIHAIVPQSPTVESENTSSPMEGIVQEKKTKSRKEKSLNVLCDRFINHYKQRSNGQPLEFQLDQATAELGVEKRRIYDIVNVLESINIVKKRAVSMFTWNGFNGLNDTLRVLRVSILTCSQPNKQIDGIKDATLYDGISTLSDEKENAPLRDAMKKFNPTREAKSSKTEKGEKLLMQLSQKFIQLFLVTQVRCTTALSNI